MERICLLIGITLPLHGLHKFASDLEKLLKKKIHEYEIQEEQVEELEELLPVPTSFSWIPFPDDLIASQITLLDHLTYRSIKVFTLFLPLLPPASAFPLLPPLACFSCFSSFLFLRFLFPSISICFPWGLFLILKIIYSLF